MDGKQLRNSILQWAIQGKLVPQNPDDEPASVLLERIREEKARLVKEKKIKRDKNESIIYRGDDNSYYEKILATGEVKCIDDEIPFDLPMGWEWCRIRHIFTMQAGKNIKANELFEKDDQHPYPCYGGNGIRGYMSRYNNNGVFPIVGRQGALCGNINMASGKFFATEHAVVTDTYGLSDPYWAQWFLMALNLNQYATATAQPGLAVSNIIEVLIALPPLKEQHRIVERLDYLLPLVQKFDNTNHELSTLNGSIKPLLKKSILHQAIQGRLVEQDPNDEPASELLEHIRTEKQRLVKEGKLKKSALQDSAIYRGDDNKYYENLNGKIIDITDQIPFDVPQSWRWVRLKDIGTWGAGATPNRSSLDYYTNGTIPWIKTGELNNGVVIDSIEKVTAKALEECSLRMVNIGDVLIAMYGATIGKLAIAGIQLTTNQACCACTPFGGIYNWYLFYYLMANKESLIEMGAGGAQPNISREKIVQFLFALPPLNEQKRIVAKVEELFAVIDEMNM